MSEHTTQEPQEPTPEEMADAQVLVEQHRRNCRDLDVTADERKMADFVGSQISLEISRSINAILEARNMIVADESPIDVDKIITTALFVVNSSHQTSVGMPAIVRDGLRDGRISFSHPGFNMDATDDFGDGQ